jgi:hypothetical protein
VKEKKEGTLHGERRPRRKWVKSLKKEELES